jgi:hypothetical protein
MTALSEGQQHVRCVFALAALRLSLDMLSPLVMETPLNGFIIEIEKKYQGAKEVTGSRSLSAGAKRALTVAFRKLGEKFSTAGLSPESLFVAWGANIVCCGLLLRDCITVCPKYASAASWIILSNQVDFLSEKLCEVEPLTDERGFNQYLEIAF